MHYDSFKCECVLEIERSERNIYLERIESISLTWLVHYSFWGGLRMVKKVDLCTPNLVPAELELARARASDVHVT